MASCYFDVELVIVARSCHFHMIIVDELCIAPALRVFPTPPVLDAPQSLMLFEDIGAIEVL